MQTHILLSWVGSRDGNYSGPSWEILSWTTWDGNGCSWFLGKPRLGQCLYVLLIFKTSLPQQVRLTGPSGSHLQCCDTDGARGLACSVKKIKNKVTGYKIKNMICVYVLATPLITMVYKRHWIKWFSLLFCYVPYSPYCLPLDGAVAPRPKPKRVLSHRQPVS